MGAMVQPSMPAPGATVREVPGMPAAQTDTQAIQEAAHGQLQEALHQLFNGEVPQMYRQALTDNPDWDAEDFVRELGVHMFQTHGIHPEHLFSLIGAGP